MCLTNIIKKQITLKEDLEVRRLILIKDNTIFAGFLHVGGFIEQINNLFPLKLGLNITKRNTLYLNNTQITYKGGFHSYDSKITNDSIFVFLRCGGWIETYLHSDIFVNHGYTINNKNKIAVINCTIPKGSKILCGEQAGLKIYTSANIFITEEEYKRVLNLPFEQ